MIGQINNIHKDVQTGRRRYDDVSRLELFWEAEKTLIMHKLSKEYFGYRAYWFNFLPLLIITTITTIIGFLTTGMSMEHLNGVEVNIKGLSASAFAIANAWLNLSVGFLGTISSFLTSMSKHTKYQSKRDMHEMAEDALRKVVQSLSFDETDDVEMMRGHIDKQKAIFMSVEAACTAPIPTQITQAFVELDSAMKMKDFGFKVNYYKQYYNMLWQEFTKKSCCMPSMPRRVPEINVRYGSLGKLIEEDYTVYMQGKHRHEVEQIRPESVYTMRTESVSSGNQSENVGFDNQLQTRDFPDTLASDVSGA